VDACVDYVYIWRKKNPDDLSTPPPSFPLFLLPSFSPSLFPPFPFSFPSFSLLFSSLFTPFLLSLERFCPTPPARSPGCVSTVILLSTVHACESPGRGAYRQRVGCLSPEGAWEWRELSASTAHAMSRVCLQYGWTHRDVWLFVSD
jgi:hypothetical protein